MVARYGGEEFVVMLPSTTPDAALGRIEALRREVANTPMDLGDGQALTINFSAGIAGTPADAEATTPQALLTLCRHATPGRQTRGPRALRRVRDGGGRLDGSLAPPRRAS